jgi:hypothetical protein
MQWMFQHKAVLRTAIAGCKINGFCVLSATSFARPLLRPGVEELPARRLTPLPETSAIINND